MFLILKISMFNAAKFNGDISQWNVSNVKNMKAMFASTSFNGDISKWDVSSVKDMMLMFNSSFNGDLTNWKPYSLEDVENIFSNSKQFIPFWANLDDKNERNKAIKRYELEHGIFKELNEKLC